MQERELDDYAWIRHPYTWRNNRGAIKTAKGYLTYGLPPPPHGRKEDPNEMKGGDRIGFTTMTVTQEMVGKPIAVFTSIELKTSGDRAAPGQVKWAKFVREHGGIAWFYVEQENGEVRECLEP